MNESEREKQYGKTLWQWLIPSRKFLKWFFFVSISFVGAAWIFVQLVVFFYIKPLILDSFGPGEYQKTQEFFNTTLDFPEEYIAGVPLSTELEKAYIDADKTLAEMNQNRPIDDSKNVFDEWIERWQRQKNTPELDEEFFRSVVQGLEPAIDAGFRLSEQIERDITPLSSGEPLPIYGRHPGRYLPRGSLAELFTLTAQYLDAHQKPDEALQLYAAALPLRVECPYQNFEQFMHRYKFTEIVREASLVAPHASSIETLRTVLQRLKRIEPSLYRDVYDRYNQLAFIDLIKRHKRFSRGEFDATPGKKRSYYVTQIAESKIPEMNFFHSIAFTWQWALSGRQPIKDEIFGVIRPFALTNVFDCYFYTQKFRLSNESDRKKEATMDAAEYDILLLTVAARLYELETGNKVAATTDLVPAYFSEEIKDRQSGKSFIWNENGQLFGY